MIWCDMIPPEPLVPRGLVSLPFSTRNVLGAQKIGWSKHVLNCFEFLNWKSCFQPFALNFCISALPSSVTTTTKQLILLVTICWDYGSLWRLVRLVYLNLLDVGWHSGWHHLAQVVPQGSDQGFCNKLIKQHKGGLRIVFFIEFRKNTKNIETWENSLKHPKCDFALRPQALWWD